MATDYAKELSTELKLARGVAQKSIYQKGLRRIEEALWQDIDLQDGDLVLLKV